MTEIIHAPESNINMEFREKISNAESLMMQEQQVELTTKHYFSNGLYARELHIPAGTLLTGKIHADEHLNIVSKGKILVATEDGAKEISAPATIVSLPNTKRIGYAVEDTVWTTIHPNPDNLDDLEKLEATLINIDYDALPNDIMEKLS